ncbi:MAG: AEC family transporter [Bacteroidota bacterium]
MDDIFWMTSQSVFGAMLRIFFIMFLAGFLVRKKIITPVQIAALSKVTVYVLLPSLILSNNLVSFHPGQDPNWWVLPLLGAGMTMVGLAIAFVLYLPDLRINRDMLPLSSMQNAAYLVLPIVQILYPDNFPTFALFVFLYIIGANPLIWSIGKVLITSGQSEKVSFKMTDFLTPPLIVNIIAIVIVLLSVQHFVPDFVIDSTELLGEGAVPIATFILGATLGGISFKEWPSFSNILRVIGVKFAILPILTIFVLFYFEVYKFNPLLADFLVVQSAVAPATAIVLQVKTYGGNEQKIGGMMLISYVVCLLVLPLWMAYWKSITM